MKKVLSILMVFLLTFLLIACSSSGKEEAEETLKGFMKAFRNLDAEAMKDYVDDETVANDFLDITAISSGIKETIPAELSDYEDDFVELFEDFLERIMKLVSYEVKEVEENDNEYVFVLDLTAPDFSDYDFGDIIAESVDEEFLEQLVLDKYNAGEITETTSEKDLYKIIAPEIIKQLEKALDDVEVEVETKEKEIVIFKQGGKWLVDTEASDIG